MTNFSTRWIPTALAVASLAALTACGGDSESLQARATASNDSATVPWNRATTLSVTSNDTIANGTASVAVTTAPAHGTAVVDGNGIVYTPTAGYFGSDTLSYTLHVGDQTSVATVQLSVAAHMVISGTVRDDDMPGAQVVLTVGGTALPAVTADSSGNYSVDVTTTAPTDFITLQARGVGAQSNVVLSSLVGDALATAAVAASDGSVSAAVLPAANVTNVTTAEAVLTAQALGKQPTSSQDIASVAGQFSSAQTIQMATAIKLVADAGVALPDGAANTLALVSDPAAYSSFVTTQATTNSALFNSTKAAVVSDPSIAVAPPAPVAGQPDLDMVLTLGQGAGANGVTKMTLRADGTAVVAGSPAQTATWVATGSEIQVTYDQPSVGTTYLVASDGFQHAATETDTGFKVRQLGTGTATQDFLGSTTFTEGPDVGSVTPLPETWLTETIVTTTKAFEDADFAIGTEWAGVLTTDFDPNTANYTSQDTLKIVDGMHVLYERTGVTGTYQLNGGSLDVATSDGKFLRYTHLFKGPKGEERWLITPLVEGQPSWVFDAAVVKVTPGLGFSTATASADYLSYVNAGLATGQYYIDLLVGGIGAGSSTPGTANLQRAFGMWMVGEDGTETLTTYYCHTGINGVGSCTDADIAYNASNGETYGQTRSWKLLAVSGNDNYVMEHLTTLGGTYDQYRINVYTKMNAN